MAFDAGAIEARLTIDTAQASADLDKIEARVRRLEDSPHVIKVTAVFDDASLMKARTAFTTLDSMISRDAMQRMRSSPYGSVIGTLNALFSPHPLAGGPTAQQAASRGLLGQMLAQQAASAVPGTRGGRGQTLGDAMTGPAVPPAGKDPGIQFALPAAALRTLFTSMLPAGGPVMRAGRGPAIPLELAGPYKEQIARLAADIAALERSRVKIPVDFGLPDKAALARFVSSLKTAGPAMTLPVARASAGTAAGDAEAAAGGDARSATARLLSLAAAASSATEAARYAYAADKALTGQETDVAGAAREAAGRLRDLASASTGAADAGKYAYAATIAEAIAARAAGDAAADTAAKTGILSDHISRGLPVYTAAAGRFGFLQSHVQLFGGALTSVGIPAIIGAASGLHLVTEAVIETAGTLIPAAVAFTAFGIAAVPTAKDLYAQLKSVYTVNQAFGAQIQPLTGSFTKMAQAVQPKVYTLLGEAFVFASRSTGSFSQLAQGAGKVLDDLGARFVYATTQGHGFSAFVGKAASDLAGWGNLIGNIGGIIGGLLKTVPGYAETILSLLNSVTHAIEMVVNSGLGQWILRIGLAAHGAVLYIGLLATGFAVLASRGLAAAAPAILNAAIWLEKLGPAGKAAAGGLTSVAAGAEKAAGLPWGWISVAATALGFLIYKLATAKDSVQQFNASVEHAVQNSSLQNLSTTISSAMDQTARKLAAVSGQLAAIPKPAGAVIESFHGIQNKGAIVYDSLKRQVSEYSSGLQALEDQQSLVTRRVGDLSKQYGGQAAALALLNGAGITTAQILDTNKQHWAEALIEIDAYNRALNIGVTSNGQYQASLNALNFASGDSKNQLGQTASAVQQVNQAESQLLSTITGGRSALDIFEQGIYTLAGNLNQATGSSKSVTSTLAGLKNQASLVGATLNGTSQASYALNQAFYQQVQNGQQLITSLQTEAASAGQLQTVVATVAGQMLGFAGTSVEARTVIADLINGALGPGTVSLQNMNKWVGQNSTSMAGLNSILAQVTTSASQLAGVLQQNLNQMLAQAAAQAYGGQHALDTFAAAVLNGASSAAQLAQNGGAQVLRMFQQMYQGDVPRAQKAFEDWAQNGLGLSKQQAYALWQQLITLQDQIDKLHGKTIDITAVLSTALGPGAGKAAANLQNASGYATGGYISDGTTGTADDVPLWGSKGEYMVRASSVTKYGTAMMDAINAGTWGGGMGVLGGPGSGPGAGRGPWPGWPGGPGLPGTGSGQGITETTLGPWGFIVADYTGVVSPSGGGFGLTRGQLGLPASAPGGTGAGSGSQGDTGGTVPSVPAGPPPHPAGHHAEPDLARTASIRLLTLLMKGYVRGNQVARAVQADTLLNWLGDGSFNSQLSQVRQLDAMLLAYRRKKDARAARAVEQLLSSLGVRSFTPQLKASGNVPKTDVIRMLERLMKSYITENSMHGAGQVNSLLTGLGVTKYSGELSQIRWLDSLLARYRKAHDAKDVAATEELLRTYGVRKFAQGGTLWEPVVGFGTRSGGAYMFAEKGPETVVPGQGAGGADVVAELRALRGQMNALIRTTAAVPQGVASGVGSAIGGAAQSAAFRQRYPARGY